MRRKIRTLLIAVLALVCLCAAQAGACSLLVEPQELAAALESGEGIFVDLRPEKAYNRMHIPGFVHMPYGETDLSPLAGEEGPVYLICAMGRTSARAYNELIAAGAKNVHAAVFGVEEYAEAMGLENMEGADICVPCILLQKQREAREREEEAAEETAEETAEEAEENRDLAKDDGEDEA